ncbi:pentatricopeptide repeat domain-containing protein [Allomyces macrogynus ATCC 38327]|uniref:Pentatricopeptide repeat domain-containing protein n=1 Tax=Allomyces macrogynus (strain ATCC 38327) TaxID=578462 RepID=A0A0L0SWA8_ALLM3|nr:pentatricopeptide repeat domain-containing protein [Allomyces macrogynus ATCC 38327]|eukprot:KNE66756.1 pentatricopeptide repeat domain-containing protein [Allomyces macrogynus ATCC 38327]
MSNLSSLLLRIQRAVTRRDTLAALREAEQHGLFSPPLAEAAIDRVLQRPAAAEEPTDNIAELETTDPTQYATEFASLDATSAPSASSSTSVPDYAPVDDGDLTPAVALAEILRTPHLTRPDLVWGPTAFRGMMRHLRTQTPLPAPAIAQLHAQYTQSPDLVPMQTMIYVHVTAIEAAAAANHGVGVARALDRAWAASSSRGYRASVASAAIVAYISKLKDLDRAVTLFEETAASGVVPTRQALAALVQAVVQRHQRTRFDRLEKAEEYVHAAMAAADASTYAILVQVALDKGQPDFARALLARAKAAELPLSWHAYRPFLEAAARRGDLEAIDRVLDQARADHVGAAEAMAKDSARVADVVVGALADAGHDEAARQMVAALPAEARTVGVYNVWIRALMRRNQLDEAVAVLDHDMPAGGVEPDPVTYNTLVHGLAKGGRLEARVRSARTTRQLWIWVRQRMTDAGIEPDAITYDALIEAYLATDRFARHNQVLDTYLALAPEVGLTAPIIDSVLNSCRAARKPETAAQIVHHLDPLPESATAIPPPGVFTLRPRHWALYLDTLASAGQFDAALAVLDGLERRQGEVRPDVGMMEAITRPLRNAKRYDAVDRLQRHLLARYPSIKEELSIVGHERGFGGERFARRGPGAGNGRRSRE